MKKKKTIPLPGQRILRSALAVGVCLLIYVLRGHQGIPLYSALAAMQCMTPYTSAMKGVGQKRILGTIIGAVWGLLLLLIEGIPQVEAVLGEVHLLLIPLTLILVLYSTVLMGVQETAFLSGTVFLVITINHASDVAPYIFAFNRLLDTVIGVLVAYMVNRLHLPRRQERDILFVAALGNSLLDSERQLSPYSKVELNRLLDDGMHFSLSTVETPATVRELTPGLRFKDPIITMDGAALYDLGTLSYLRTTPMAEETARDLMAWLRERNLAFFANSIEQNLLVIRYRDLPNEGMKTRFETKRVSPYRNFIRSERDMFDHVVYLTVIDEKERLEKAYLELSGEEWKKRVRAEWAREDNEGFGCLKIYDASCSREAMLHELEKRMNLSKTVTLGGIPGKYDVFIENADRNLLVKELKRRYEPVDFRHIRDVFR